MKLLEISKLPPGSYKVIDHAKERFEPLSWENVIHVLYQNKHKAVRRKTAFPYGLCAGVPGSLPPISQRGGIRQGCGRKPLEAEKKKYLVPGVWLELETIKLLGGKEKIHKMFENLIKSKL